MLTLEDASLSLCGVSEHSKEQSLHFQEFPSDFWSDLRVYLENYQLFGEMEPQRILSPGGPSPVHPAGAGQMPCSQGAPGAHSGCPQLPASLTNHLEF